MDGGIQPSNNKLGYCQKYNSNYFQLFSMKNHYKQIQRVEDYLKSKEGVLTENTAHDPSFEDWDISLTGITKNNRVSTYTVKPNNTYNNDKVCIEFRKRVDGEFVASGLGAATSEYVILTFYDDRKLYMIKRERLISYAYATTHMPVDKYVAYDKNQCQLALFDRPALLRMCRII